MKEISPVLVEEFNEIIYQETTTPSGIEKSDLQYPTSFSRQCNLLLSRMFLQSSRNKSVLYIQFFHHLLSGVLIGLLFYDIGNNATQTPAIFKYCVSCNVFFMYTHVMMPVLLCKFG